MASEPNSFHVDFPDFSSNVLKRLNQQRQLGQLCDITVVLQGQQYRAHRAVLAASSSYFCDQVLLKNSQQVVLPDVMQARVFESLLQSCYTGVLQLPAGEVVGFLTAASFLQMWHVVGKCTELLGGGPAKLCLSPTLGHSFLGGGSGYDSPIEDLDGEDFGRVVEYVDGEVERVMVSSCSPKVPEAGSQAKGSASSAQECLSRGRISHLGNSLGNQQARAVDAQPGGGEHEETGDGGGLQDARLHEGAGKEKFELCAIQPADNNTEVNLEDELERNLNGGQPYKSPPDCFKASVNANSTDTAEDYPDSQGQELGMTAGVGDQRDGPLASPTGLQKEITSSTTVLPRRDRGSSHSSLQEHKEPRPALRPYACAICGRVFRLKRHLLAHVRVHVDVTPHKCHVCGERFRSKDRFGRHLSFCVRARRARQTGTPLRSTDPAPNATIGL
ncbi:zinc finger and BTB domain-containing protein 43-like [Brienomyrus brachyistius]|uniref:zinc finger and BTB domain-containing protein 43-like n=1 Tax=Brienomyrus brachyistius TaxID=42636 RepID=UPI0020B1CE62|nr:zinc finger and BTB domain-containing protein 43-like [Brienomyrus brachyistius]